MLSQLGFLVLKLGSKLRNAPCQNADLTLDTGRFRSLWNRICREKMVEVIGLKLGSGHGGGFRDGHFATVRDAPKV
jgi:hypothetical protein